MIIFDHFFANKKYNFKWFNLIPTFPPVYSSTCPVVFLPSFPTFLSQTFTKCVLCTKHCAGAIVGSETSMMLALLDITVYWKETHTKQIKRELHTGLRTKKVVHKGNYNFTWERCFIDPIPSKFISTGWPKFTIFVSGMLFPFSLIIHNLYG